ncbi:hypothetical protein F4804DRAFT_318183 [Jackrogersella minutella]|nr:hypothetical protein F4804DRAFT_318183 [Jackrogersella minutella]
MGSVHHPILGLHEHSRKPTQLSRAHLVFFLWKFGFIPSLFIDRYKRFGYAFGFVASWTMVGLIAIYNLPVTTGASWSFYAAYIVTTAAPTSQPLNDT